MQRRPILISSPQKLNQQPQQVIEPRGRGRLNALAEHDLNALLRDNVPVNVVVTPLRLRRGR